MATFDCGYAATGERNTAAVKLGRTLVLFSSAAPLIQCNVQSDVRKWNSARTWEAQTERSKTNLRYSSERAVNNFGRINI